MKVLHIISGRDSGGARTHVLSLLRQPEIKDMAVLLCLGDGVLAQDARAAGIETDVASGGFFQQKKAVEKALREGAYDILHCHGARANVLGAILRNGSCKKMTTLHSDHRLDYLGRPLAQLSYGLLNSAALRKMDALECVSESMAQTYRKRGFAAGRVYSIFNGVSFCLMEPMRETSGDEIVIGTLSRLEKVKDLATLLYGFALAASENPRLRLIVAGTGRQERNLRQLVKKWGISHRVHFAGWIENTAAFYRSIDIFVLTSLSETFPYALTGAAQYALPVIATNVGGIPELVETGESGILISPHNTEQLRKAIEELASHARLRMRLGRTLQQKVCSEFTEEAMSVRQRSIYASVLRGERRGVILAGAYGQGNVGDEAMLFGILQQIRKAGGEEPVSVVSRKPKGGKNPASLLILPARNPVRLRRAMKTARLFLSGGGNLLQDITSRRSLFYYLWQLKAAKDAGCRTMLYAAGLGPLSAAGLRRTSRVLNRCADRAVFRDRTSLQAALTCGYPREKTEWMADPALEYPCLPKASSDTARIFEEPYITVCLCTWPQTEEIRRRILDAVNVHASRAGVGVVLLAMSKKDEKLSKALRKTAPGSLRYVACHEDPDVAVRILSGGQMTVSMRLHGLILSVACGVPAIGIACDERIPAFAREAGMAFLSLSDLAENSDPLRVALENPSTYRAANLAEMKHRLQTGIRCLEQELS